jgi:GH15 family glucan-1,4-alpha-glucosidase
VGIARQQARVHTFSAVMCWAACDRLARIASQTRVGRNAPSYWRRAIADALHASIESARLERAAWDSFVATFDGDTMDASLLLLAQKSGSWTSRRPALSPPRCGAVETGSASGRLHLPLRRERRLSAPPPTPSSVCTFWYVNALAVTGAAVDEARALFEQAAGLPQSRHGLLAEHIDPTQQASNGATSCRPTAWSD